MGERPYRVIQGVAYPPLVRGRNSTSQISSCAYDRDAYYYDDAIKLSEADIKANDNLTGMPLCIEHNESAVVGEVTRSWTDQEGKLRFLARIYTDTPAGRDAVSKVESGQQKGVSVGYVPVTDLDGTVHYKKFRELSLCERGFFPGAEVGILASKSNAAQYKSPADFLYVNYEIMAEKIDQPTATTAAAAVPVTPTPTDAGEVTRQADQLLKEKAALEQEVAALRAEYVAKKQGEYNRALEGAAYAYKAKHGEDAVLPQVFVEGSGVAFATPQLGKATEVQYLVSDQLLQERDRRIAIEASVTELKKQAAEQAAQLAEYQKREAQLSERLGRPKAAAAVNPAEAVAAVTASAVSSGLVPKPSPAELEILMRDYGQQMQMTHLGPVRASGASTFKTDELAPNPYRAEQRGMRARHPDLFSFLKKAVSSNPSLAGLQHTVTDQTLQ